MKAKNKWRIFLIILVLIISTAVFCVWQNNSIVISEFYFSSEKIPSSFDHFKILQISDFHNKKFGRNQNTIIGKIKSCSPDIIVITGDLIDRRRYNLETAMELMGQLPAIAPVFYVPGNHEAWSGQYDKIKDQLKKAEVTVLENQAISYTVGQEFIDIVGLKDPDFLTSNDLEKTDTTQLELPLSNHVHKNHFTVLLSHRPELMDLYKKHNVDLAFTGHAHGGQIRLPILGGLIAPDQGFFPKYDAGRYDEAGTTMFVSRGLGNSLFPLRIFNRPELVVVTLESGK